MIQSIVKLIAFTRRLALSASASLSMVFLRRTMLLVFLFVINQTTFALPTDKDQLLVLSADLVELNEQKHHGEYQGHVCLDQGSSHLRASSAMTQGDVKNQLIVAIAKGDSRQQAHYWTQTEVNKPLLHAHADLIRYYPMRHLIELIGHAALIQQEHSLTASKISYDTLKQRVLSQSDGKERIVIRLHPGQSS